MFTKRNDIQKPAFNLALGTNSTSLIQHSPVSEFQSVDVTYYDGDEKHTAKSYVNDIYLLFNQQRLTACGRDTIQAWLNSLTPRSDALAELRKKCSDDQLIAICKSRYIQSPSELLAWSEYLNRNYENIVEMLKPAEPAEPAEPASVEPAPAPVEPAKS